MVDGRRADYGIAQCVALFEVLGEEDLGLSLKGAAALFVLCALTMHPRRPRLPNVTDMATALRMTASGASRVLSNLEAGGFVESNRDATGGRSGAFNLTDKGKALMEKVLIEANLISREEEGLSLHNIATFAQAKFIERIENQVLDITFHDTELRTIHFVPMDSKFVAKVQDWAQEYYGHPIEYEHKADEMIFRFESRADLVTFLLRWSSYRMRNYKRSQ